MTNQCGAFWQQVIGARCTVCGGLGGRLCTAHDCQGEHCAGKSSGDLRRYAPDDLEPDVLEKVVLVLTAGLIFVCQTATKLVCGSRAEVFRAKVLPIFTGSFSLA